MFNGTSKRNPPISTGYYVNIVNLHDLGTVFCSKINNKNVSMFSFRRFSIHSYILFFHCLQFCYFSNVFLNFLIHELRHSMDYNTSLLYTPEKLGSRLLKFDKINM